MRDRSSLGLPTFTSLGAAVTGGFADALVSWTSPSAPPRCRPRPFWLGLAMLPAVAVAGIWVGIRVFPWFGPLLADTLRATLGSETVTALEEMSADVEDRVRLAVGSTEARGLSDSTPEELTVLTQVVPVEPAITAFRPSDVEPMFVAVSSVEDGKWQPVPVALSAGAPLHRTIIHPDPERAYAELFVFALDLSQVKLHFAAGSIEPKRAPGAQGTLERSGRIREDDAANVIAAFNGGFKSEHGHFGMMVDGVEIAPPKATSCTIAADAEGSLRIGTWSELAPQASSFTAWRQTPACMAEGGKLHPGLRDDSTNWGATIDGKTVIRRSAMGLDRERKTLYVGISNSTTARALATGMMHVGAADVAQLDVNYSYPKFVLYTRDGAGELAAMTAVKGFDVDRDAYLERPSPRDFFYVTARR
ncbi:MAG: hypothetical protein JW751_22810 [Polyangiaceae bacterium]|nr:hypothetical protein [Polyangiaceae bacterium]